MYSFFYIILFFFSSSFFSTSSSIDDITIEYYASFEGKSYRVELFIKNQKHEKSICSLNSDKTGYGSDNNNVYFNNVESKDLRVRLKEEMIKMKECIVKKHKLYVRTKIDKQGNKKTVADSVISQECLDQHDKKLKQLFLHAQNNAK